MTRTRKLTDADVRGIRLMANSSIGACAISVHYGESETLIGYILSGERKGGVPMEGEACLSPRGLARTKPVPRILMLLPQAYEGKHDGGGT